MSVHKKLQEARVKLQNTKIAKSGLNKFAGYQYFELGDFMPIINQIFNDVGLCGVISFTTETATLTITDVDSGKEIVITSPSAEVVLKGCLPIQGLGAAQTYLRRYLWVAALEIVEHDALDALTGKDEKKTITPTTGVWESLGADEQIFLMDVAGEVINLLKQNDIRGAVKHIEDQRLGADEKVALWTRFDSKQRSAMKRASDEMKATA